MPGMCSLVDRAHAFDLATQPLTLLMLSAQHVAHRGFLGLRVINLAVHAVDLFAQLILQPIQLRHPLIARQLLVVGSAELLDESGRGGELLCRSP